MEKSKLIETLSPNERKVLPLLKEKEVKAIVSKSGLDETSVLRSLQFLENKSIIKLKSEKRKTIDLGDNGILYLKNGLPERRLLTVLVEKKEIPLNDKSLKLSENEFKAALGALKRKALIEIKDNKLVLNANMNEISKKTLEEQFLEILPIEFEKLAPEQLHALKNLESRKDIIRIEETQQVGFELTSLGKEIITSDLSHTDKLIETLTPEMLRSEGWKSKKFRRYDVTSKVPSISGGKRHFVNQGIEYAKRIWKDMGFQEMSSTLTQTGFWNFDALFTAQDHPVREIQDTFYIKGIKGKIPEANIVKAVKQAHEKGVDNSKGWQSEWNEEESKKVILRTHTTCLSAKTLASLRNAKNKSGKFFSVGKCFRNETIDWSHGFEFNQTDGIVIDKDANFLHLLGYLKEFFKKMGFDDVKFFPSYFPYTEPSVEVYGYLKEKKQWIEIGGAGIFRPEVVIPLLGEYIPVLAWGPGFDRTLMDYYKITDLREFYNNDLNKLRNIKFWVK
ncbi:MAG: phenylalanine--tRNA ligase subunit alpha [Nanoarchaeota archaeon]